MGRGGPILDPRLRGQVQSDFPSVCTIRQKLFTKSAANQDVPNGFSNVITIACRLMPLMDGEKRGNQIESNYRRGILKLNGIFNIQARWMDAVVDGVTWEIRGIEQDSQAFCTRLRVEILLPTV